MTLEENVAFGLKRKKVSKNDVKKRVADELERVGLGKEAKRKPAQLSGGQQQRVALARALVNLPKVLLLDEPLGALDLKLRKALQVELKNIQRDVGITFVYVTHDQEEALTMSDRIAVMNEGRIEQCAGPEAVYEHPATTFVAGFIGVSNLMPAIATGGNDVKLDNGPTVSSPDAAEFSSGERCFAVVRAGEVRGEIPTQPPRRTGRASRAWSRLRSTSEPPPRWRSVSPMTSRSRCWFPTQAKPNGNFCPVAARRWHVSWKPEHMHLVTESPTGSDPQQPSPQPSTETHQEGDTA